jgi:hypothetical protein
VGGAGSDVEDVTKSIHWLAKIPVAKAKRIRHYMASNNTT